MIVLLLGPDDYRRDAKRKEIAAEFEKKHSGLGFSRFDLSAEGELERLREFLESQSIFEAAKLASVTGIWDSPEAAKTLKTFGERAGTTILISAAEKPPKAFDFLKKSKNMLIQEFPHLSGPAWRKFLRQETDREGAKLSPAALEYLAQAYQNDAWRAVTEIRKIALWDREVERGDLEELDIELTPDFWRTVNGLKSPRLSERLMTFERVSLRNEPAAKIFNILAAQWPDRIGRFAAYDLAVKSGRCDYEEALTDLVLG